MLAEVRNELILSLPCSAWERSVTVPAVSGDQEWTILEELGNAKMPVWRLRTAKPATWLRLRTHLPDSLITAPR